MLRFAVVFALALIGSTAVLDRAGFAQEEGFRVPDLQHLGPGVPGELPDNSPGLPDSAYADFVSVQASGTQYKDAVARTRGPQDVSLFREAAPSVVLIKTDKGFGSGSILKVNADLRSNPFILTNFHVIGQNREITVVFRPLNPTGAPSEDEVVKAAVVKIDPRRDLALVRPRSLPNREIHPLKISSAEIEVGMDVSAIGHPEGKDWTYTKGVVSAVRPNFEWSYEDGSSHRATIIQTQTPINPGNSGGPLLAVDGSLVGVNSFRATGAEGLNFAVAASEVTAFLQNSADGLEALKVCNQPKTIFEGRKEKVAGFLKMISFHCDDEADIIVVIPDNRRQAVYAVVDFKRRGKPEGIVFDERRSGKWNTSVWDTVLDDTFAMRGIHPDGEFMPKRLVPRCGNRKPLPDLKCS